jgi:hypothetical protein
MHEIQQAAEGRGQHRYRRSFAFPGWNEAAPDLYRQLKMMRSIRRELAA